MVVETKLVIFDFDFTLAKTTECVKLWSPRGNRTEKHKKFKYLTPEEFNAINIASDEYLDDESFVEFNSVDFKKAKKIYPVMVFFESFLDSQETKVIVLSARPQCAEKTIKQFLKLHVKKTNHDKIDKLVYKGCHSGDPKQKYQYIKHLVKTSNLTHSLDEIMLFEDSVKNINYFYSLINTDFPNIQFSSCYIKHSRSTQTLEFKK